MCWSMLISIHLPEILFLWMLMLHRGKRLCSYHATVCRKARHKALDCDLHFNICMCTVNELQGFLEDKLAALDVVMEEDDITVEEDKLKVQDFAICNE